MALKADELYQSVSLLLSEILDKSLQVNTVSSCTCPPKTPLSRRSPTPASTSRSPTLPGACGFHKKHGDKAVTCRSLVPFWKTSSPAGGNSHPTCWFFSSSIHSRRDLLLLPYLSERHPLRSQVLVDSSASRLCGENFGRS